MNFLLEQIMNKMADPNGRCQTKSRSFVHALAQAHIRWQNCDMSNKTNDQGAKARDAKAADPALGAALRANLLKRKQQLRARQDSPEPSAKEEN